MDSHVVQNSHLVPVYLDEWSGGSEQQIKQINSTLRTEYARFQRASFAKEEDAPLVKKSISVPGAYIYDVTDRSYGQYHTLFFKLDLTTVDAGMEIVLAELDASFPVPVFQCGTDGDKNGAEEVLPGYFLIKGKELRFLCTLPHAGNVYSCYVWWCG